MIDAEIINEATVYTVAIGNLPLPWQGLRAMRTAKKVLKWAAEQDGYVGIFPHYPEGTLLLYKTKNDAIRAKNVLDYKGVKTGDNIGECYVPEEYVEGAKE